MFLLGAWRNEGPSVDQVTEAIDRLCLVLKTSSLIEDKRQALDKLLYISREYPQVSLDVIKLDSNHTYLHTATHENNIQQVGVQALNVVLDALHSEQEDEQTVMSCIDILKQVFKDPDTGNELMEVALNSKSRLFDPLISVIDALNQPVKTSAMHILLMMSQSSSHMVRQRLQEAVMASPDIVQSLLRLIDLTDTRIPALQLLSQISSGASDIQKLIVFSGAAERAIQLLREEGGVLLGGLVVRECLQFISSVIVDNPGNQEYIVSQPALLDVLLSLFSSEDHLELEESSRNAKNELAAWKMLSDFLTPHNRHLERMQLLFQKLLPAGCAYAIQDNNPQAILFLSRLLSGNDKMRVLFMKHHMNKGHAALYLLVQATLNNDQLMPVMNSLLCGHSPYPDGQLAIASTMAPGAESPGLLIIESLVSCGDVHLNAKKTELTVNSLKLLTLLISGNEQVKLLLARHKITNNNQQLLDHLITELLILPLSNPNHMNEQTIAALLMCLCMWLDDCGQLIEYLRLEMGGLVQCLLELVMYTGSRANNLTNDLSLSICGLATVLLSLMMLAGPSNDLWMIIESRLGSALLLKHLDSLCANCMTGEWWPEPFKHLVMLRYPDFVNLFFQRKSKEKAKIIELELEIASLRQLVNDPHGSINMMWQEIGQLRANNAALLEQLEQVEDERQSLLQELSLCTTSPQPKQNGAPVTKTADETVLFFKNLKSVLLPEFEDRKA